MSQHECGFAMKKGKKGYWCPWCWANEEVHRIQEGSADEEDIRNEHAREGKL